MKHQPDFLHVYRDGSVGYICVNECGISKRTRGNMAIMGRPKKNFDVKEFEKLCGMQATKIEIAAWFDMDEKTLECRVKETYGETFSVVFGKKKGVGKISLRRKQWQMADKSAAMAIFLGKNHLGQADRVDTDNVHQGSIILAYNLDKEPEE